MKKRRSFRVVLIIVAALAVLAVSAFGVRALMSRRGFVPGMVNRIPYDMRGDMLLDSDNLPDGMPYGRSYPRGMMPFSAHRRGGFSSPLVGLLILGLLGLGVLYLVQMHRFRRMAYYGHMHPGHFPPECYPHRHHHTGAAPAPEAPSESPEVTSTEEK